MKANQVKDVELLKPNPEGNKVYLAHLPEYVEDVKGDKYKITVIDAETKKAERSFNIFDPFGAKPETNEKIVAANWNKLFRFYRAFMDDATYETFADIEFESLKDLIQKGNKMCAVDSLNTEATFVFGYSKRTGYIDLPMFEPCISTKYASRDLEYPVSLSATPVANPTHPSKPKDSAAPKADEEDDDEV